MAEEPTHYDVVIASDCLVEGEPFLRGEERRVTRAIYRELMAAGRVARDEAAQSAAKKDAVARIERERAESEAAKVEKAAAKVEKPKG